MSKKSFVKNKQPQAWEIAELLENYNQSWNPHYDFASPKNLAEIARRQEYSRAFQTVYGGGTPTDSPEYEKSKACLLEYERKELGGKDGYAFGVIVKKDWGSNEVLSFEDKENVQTCIKKITVKPYHMLSLQSHEGRKEQWRVVEGVLTLISDGTLFEVSDLGVFEVTGAERQKVEDPAIAVNEGEHWSIILPKGSIHCMINREKIPVTVIETQTGITREADNNRFIDQLRGQDEGRATLPLTSDLHYRSALLYWQIEAENAAQSGFGWKVSYLPAGNKVA